MSDKTVPLVVLLVLLAASNAAWLILRSENPATPATPGAGDASLGRRITELEQELVAVRAQLETARSATPGRTPLPASRPVVRRDPVEEAAAAAAHQREDVERGRAFALAKEWTEAALQITDPARSRAALDAIRAALARGTETVEVHAALLALSQLRELAYDKASFRDLVLPCFSSADGDVRAASLFALWNTVTKPEDVTRLVAMVGDPAKEVRSRLVQALVFFAKGEMEGPVGDAVLTLWDDADPHVRRNARHSLQGIRPTPAIEQKFFELLSDPEQRRNAIRFGISMFREKSPAAVQVLLDAIAEPGELAEIACRGLSQGVPPQSRRVVADAFLRLLQSRAQNHELYLRCLAEHGDASHVTALEAYAANPHLPERSRTQAQQTIAWVRRR